MLPVPPLRGSITTARATACVRLLASLLIAGSATMASASPDPVTLTRVPGTPALELVGEIPIDGGFTVRHRVRATTRAVMLQVWPRAVQPDCDGEMPPYDAPQTHLVEMTISGEDPARWATAAVPHLQVDRSFCFRIRSTESMGLAPLAGSGLVRGWLASEARDLTGRARKLAEDALNKACEASMDRADGSGASATCDPTAWAPMLERRLIATIVGSPWLRARAHRATLEASHRKTEKLLRTLLARLDTLPAAPPLDARAARRMSPADAARAHAELEARDESPAWQAWLADFEHVSRRFDDATARLDAANQAESAALDALEPLLDAAIAGFLATDAYAERLSPAARGSARTRSANNYVTPVYGVAVGLPAHGGDAWLFTYAGAHIFLEPVERTIPFDEMVGGQLAQRLSLFIGALTSDAGEIDGARVGPGLGAAYPGLGLGWRITQHLALDAVAFLYEATDDDPLIDRRSLGITGALGFTAELDIVDWLTPN